MVDVLFFLAKPSPRFFKIDQEFLDSAQASGSTATMCVVKKPKAPGGKHQLLVINAGDSRVLLGKRDGSIVDGGGTDKGARLFFGEMKTELGM